VLLASLWRVPLHLG